jgi:hypothetical protein
MGAMGMGTFNGGDLRLDSLDGHTERESIL